MKKEYEIYDSKMKKTIASLEGTLDTVRVGRASAAILNKVTVDYYGVPTSVSQIGTISTPDPKTLVIQPWDATVLKEVEKAILASDVGITPNNDGKIIRLSFPPLTEERRKELVKVVSKYAEEAKVAIRSIRRDAMEDFKTQKKNSEITEDDLKGIEKDIQSMTDDFVKQIDTICKEKEKEVLEV